MGMTISRTAARVFIHHDSPSDKNFQGPRVLRAGLWPLKFQTNLLILVTIFASCTRAAYRMSTKADSCPPRERLQYLRATAQTDLSSADYGRALQG